jgi:hypothetical protein
MINIYQVFPRREYGAARLPELKGCSLFVLSQAAIRNGRIGRAKAQSLGKPIFFDGFQLREMKWSDLRFGVAGPAGIRNDVRSRYEPAWSFLRWRPCMRG